MPNLYRQNGYSLIELIVVIVIIGILMAVAMNTLDGVEDVSRFEETRVEMDLLAHAIVGNPELVTGGVRADYGYLGDIGALPPNWDALVINPGYITWKGPYITDEFSSGAGNTYFKLDAWGTAYSAPNNIQFASIGSAQVMTRQLANSIGDLLYNRAYLTLTDYDLTPPGIDNVDSAKMLLTYPDGFGGLATKSKNPTVNGLVVFDSVPIGIHRLRTIIIPNNDTLIRMVNINPGQTFYADIQYFEDIWGSGGGTSSELEFIPASDSLSTANCFKLIFWIVNNTGAPVTISSFDLSWIGPDGYYKRADWNGVNVRSGNPALGNGDAVVFSPAQTINPGQSIPITVEQFHANPSGGGQPVDMTGTQFTADFSDGSTITFTVTTCGG